MSRWAPFRKLFGPDPRGDVEEELSFHIEMRVRELVAQGHSEAAARELALRRFGDVDAPRAECVAIDERRGRRLRRAEYFGELRQDVKYALRSLRRRPAFTAIGVLTLALGIGANSAIFSVVNAVLLRSLPFAEPERLYAVHTHYPDGTDYALSAPDFMSVAEQSRAFDGVVGFNGGIVTMTGRGEPREMNGMLVSRGFFELLGLPIALGRGFAAEDHVPGPSSAVVLDHGWWLREFGGQASTLGQVLVLNGRSYTVVGVLAPGARFGAETEVYAPVPYDETFSAGTATARRGEFLDVIGRARAGLTLEDVRAELRQLGTRLQQDFPNTNDRLTFNATSFREQLVGPVRLPLLVLMGAVGLVLLIACANVANLLLARASARQSELAVRAALGAGRARLVRQLVTESMVLGLLGGGLGLLVAYAGTSLLASAPIRDIPRLDQVRLDAPVIGFTLALALLTGVLFGLAPALHATGARLMRSLREGGRGAIGAGGQRLRSALVVAEMALAVMLLVGAGLLIRSFIGLAQADPGFQTEQAVSFRVSLQSERYRESDAVRGFYGQLEARLAALPGVRDVGGASVLPLDGLGAILGPFNIEGGEPLPDNVNSEIAVTSVTPAYFSALRTPVLLGRTISTDDRTDGPPVGVMNQAGVRKWFRDENPVGRRVLLGDGPIEIVGVVQDVRQANAGEAVAPMLYLPHTQRSTRTLRMVLRTAGDPMALAERVRAEVHALDPNLPVSDYTPLAETVAESVAAPRFYTSLLSLFAAVALALAAIGIFGVMSYAVVQRTQEISVRMALGARAGEVVRMIVGRALVLAALGLALGLAASAALARVLESQLFGVEPLDPLTIVAAVAVLGGSAALASWLPARRAAAVDPGLALREG